MWSILTFLYIPLLFHNDLAQLYMVDGVCYSSSPTILASFLYMVFHFVTWSLAQVAYVSLQSSVALLQWWYSSKRTRNVKLPLLQPYWVGSTSTLTLSQIYVTTKISWILLTTGVRYIRHRSFSSLLWGFTLGSETTSANFMSDGTYASQNDALNMAQSVLAKHSAKSLL